MRPPAAAPAPEANSAPVRRRSRTALAEHLRIPLYREGYALVVNSGLASLFGVVYWLVAARRYTPHSLGLNSAAISAMMFLAGVSQLNLMSALTRFIPVSGRTSPRLVLSSYLLAVTFATVVAIGFLLGIDLWAPALTFLRSSDEFAVWFVVATIAWCIFNLQDSVLIGLRAAVFVPIENLVFSLVKIALLVALVGASPRYGIFASWTAALIASLVPVNLLIFRRLLPRHVHRSGEWSRPPTRRQLARFVSADFLGSLFWLAATTLMPLLVVAIKGGTANAYFSLAWMMALPLYAISASTGASLVVTASRDEERLPEYARRVMMQTAGIVIPLALALAVGAPQILRLFGKEYAAHSAVTLSLLALSAIPNVVTVLYVDSYRVQRRMRAVVVLLGSLCGLAIGLAIALLPALGIAGVGVAWLIAESLVVAVLVLLEPRALWPSGRRRGSIPKTDAGRRSRGRVRNLAADFGVLDVLVRLRRRRSVWRRSREARRIAAEILVRIPPGAETKRLESWVQHRPLASASDMSVIAVGPSGESPQAVIKLPATDRALGSLGREQAVLAALHADERLQDWCRLLPTVLAEGALDGRPYVIQRMLPGLAMGRKLSSDDETRQVLTAAVGAIRELHRRTEGLITVDSGVLERWVDAPALVVRRVGARPAAARAGMALDGLADELHNALDGLTLPVSWVHGDFCPNNILVTPDGTAVAGIVDWELASAADLSSIDAVGLLLSTRAQRRRRQLGDIVRELVTGARWTDFELALLDSARTELPGDRVASRTLVLLWWLRHVAANMTKSTRYGSRGPWARWNIRVVLDALGRK